MKKAILGLLLLVSAVLVLYPTLNTLSKLPNTPIYDEARNNAIMQVFGFTFLFVFLGAVLICLPESSSETEGHHLDPNETIKEEALFSIRKNLEDAKYELMIKTLINRYKKKGLVNPELHLEYLIREKIGAGKTKEQAIEELYKEE